MNILVCFKVAPELDSLTPEEAKAIGEGCGDLRFAKLSWGVCDEAALECALRLRDELIAQKTPVTLAAATVGACPQRFFTELFAIGYDRVVQIPAEEDLSFAPRRIAFALSRLAQSGEGFDLVLAGQQSSPGENAQVPGLLASMLGIPYFGRTFDIACLKDGSVEVSSHADLGWTRVGARLPALCALENAAHPFLRMALLKNRLGASKKTCEQFEFSAAPPELKFEEPEVRLHYEHKRGNCRFLEAETPSEAAATLLSSIAREAML
ncbi:MAG: hypothetical protein AAGU74_04335 [Bacillota bacterium]